MSLPITIDPDDFTRKCEELINFADGNPSGELKKKLEELRKIVETPTTPISVHIKKLIKATEE
jgi:hypothetical protein